MARVSLAHLSIGETRLPLSGTDLASALSGLGARVGKTLGATLEQIRGAVDGSHIFRVDEVSVQIPVPSALAMERCPGLAVGGRAQFGVSRPNKGDTLVLTLQPFGQGVGGLRFNSMGEAEVALLRDRPTIRGATVTIVDRAPGMRSGLGVSFTYGSDSGGRPFSFSIGATLRQAGRRFHEGERVTVRIFSETVNPFDKKARPREVLRAEIQ